MESGKPKVLVLGGVGFIGRNFVKYLVDNDLAAYVRVVDKVLPPTAFLGQSHQEAFDKDNVEYMQGNLTNPTSIAKCYTIEGSKFNLVFNLAAETKYSQTDEVYNEKILDLSKKVAAEAAKQGVDRFIEVSTAQIYEAGKKASKEDSTTKPWTGVAKYSLLAEQAVKATDGLQWNIIRPAVVYGPGDSAGISPRLICGAVYKHLDEKMKFLWSSDLRINTVHVRDVCKALWHVATNCPAGESYNLADHNDTTQGKINSHLETLFGIKTGFLGAMVSNVAKLSMKSLTEEINDKHLKPWSELCKKEEIVNTPLTPYLDQELLYNNSLSVDGSKIERAGFTYDHPEMTTDLLREQVQYFVDQHLFPSSVLQ
ncbi:Epimerase domain-containing protein [Balamuthia mandrillaris]